MPEPNQFQASLDIDAVYRFDHGGDVPLGGDEIVAVSWNVGQGRHLEAQIQYLSSLQPDLLFLQEADWNNARSGRRNVTDEIAEALQMNSCFTVEFVELEAPVREEDPEVGQGGGVTGNAILSRSPLLNCSRVPITASSFDWENPVGGEQQRRLREQPRLGGRNAVLATAVHADAPITVASTHNDDQLIGVAGRVEQLRALLAAVDEREAYAALIGGDLNTLSTGLAQLDSRFAPGDVDPPKSFWEPEAVWLQDNVIAHTGFVDPFDKRADATYVRGWYYAAKLDWLLARGMSVLDHGMGPDELSDHHPVWVRVRPER